METESKPLINIEFFYSKECLYYPHVLETLQELIESDLGFYLIIEVIDVNSPAGKKHAKHYELKAVPSIAIEGNLKFMGVPHPTLLSNEIRKLLNNYESLKTLKTPSMES